MPEEPKSNPLPSPEANNEPISPTIDDVSRIDVEQIPSQADPMDFPTSEIEPPTGVGLPEVPDLDSRPTQPSAVTTDTDEVASQPLAQDSTFENSGIVLPETPVKKGGKKKLVIASVVVGILALLGGGGALAYSIWSQSPDKVIMDGLANLLADAPKGTTLKADYRSEDIRLGLSLETKGDEQVRDAKMTVSFANSKENIDLNASASFLTKTQDGVMYVKLNSIREPIEKAIGVMADKQQIPLGLSQGNSALDVLHAKQKAKLLKQADPIITKIDNKWVKITTKSGGDDALSSIEKCVTGQVKQLESDKTVRDEIVKAYSGNRFIVVKEQLGVKDGSYGYVLGFDATKAGAFMAAADTTRFVKGINKCVGGTDRAGSRSSEVPEAGKNFKNSRFELWISQGSHQITGVNAHTTFTGNEDESTVELGVKFSYESSKTQSEPADAIDAQPLIQEIQGLLMQNMMPGTAATLPVGPTARPVTDQNSALREMIIQQYRANNRGLQPSEAEIQKILKEYNTSNRV